MGRHQVTRHLTGTTDEPAVKTKKKVLASGPLMPAQHFARQFPRVLASKGLCNKVSHSGLPKQQKCIPIVLESRSLRLEHPWA